MKKTIKLTESDLTRIVKRVIKEEGYDEKEMWSSLSDENAEEHEFLTADVRNLMYDVEDLKIQIQDTLAIISSLIDEVESSSISNDAKEHLLKRLSGLEDYLLDPY